MNKGDLSYFASNRPRWFIRYGDKTALKKGFRNKLQASQWIHSLRREVDWRAGFFFRVLGDTTDYQIVSSEGYRAR